MEHLKFKFKQFKEFYSGSKGINRDSSNGPYTLSLKCLCIYYNDVCLCATSMRLNTTTDLFSSEIAGISTEMWQNTYQPITAHKNSVYDKPLQEITYTNCNHILCRLRSKNEEEAIRRKWHQSDFSLLHQQINLNFELACHQIEELKKCPNTICDMEIKGNLIS